MGIHRNKPRSCFKKIGANIRNIILTYCLNAINCDILNNNLPIKFDFVKINTFLGAQIKSTLQHERLRTPEIEVYINENTLAPTVITIIILNRFLAKLQFRFTDRTLRAIPSSVKSVQCVCECVFI